jgi:hypothetical protein
MVRKMKIYIVNIEEKKINIFLKERNEKKNTFFKMYF